MTDHQRKDQTADLIRTFTDTLERCTRYAQITQSAYLQLESCLADLRKLFNVEYEGTMNQGPLVMGDLGATNLELVDKALQSQQATIDLIIDHLEKVNVVIEKLVEDQKR
jgi:hypothetical protein